MKRLVLKVCGGLCNRLRSLTAARYVCERLEYGLALDWRGDQFCPGSFTELFKIPDWLTLGDPGNDDDTLHFNGSWGAATSEEWRKKFLSSETWEEMEAGSRRWALQLQPVPEIQHHICVAKRDWPPSAGNPMAGVHVRRTDHQRPTSAGKSVFTSSLPSDVALIHRLDREPENVHFFVAADNPASLYTLNAMYHGRVHQHHKQFHREKLRQTSMADAVIDLYLLAETTQIIGSFHSSYSGYAAMKGGLPIDYVDGEKG